MSVRNKAHRVGHVETYHFNRFDKRMKLAKNAVRDDDGHILEIRGARTAAMYLRRFFAIEADKSKITKKYVTVNGFSNPEYVAGLPSQGLMKTILASIKVLCDKAMDGDRDAKCHLRLLEGLLKRLSEQSFKDVLSHLDDKREDAEATRDEFVASKS